MLTYEYTARDPKTNKQVKAQVQADNDSAAAKLIQSEGLSPLSIKLVDSSSNNPIKRLRSKIGVKNKVIFSRQLATLINAGLPLTQSLRNVNGQMKNKAFQVVINQVISDIEAGKAFSVALAKHPRVFNTIYVNLISAGEASGTLDKALERIADQQEKDAEIMSKVRGAMTYPAIVLLVMMGVIGFMLVKVLPQVEVIYEDMPGAELPTITKLLLAVSNGIIDYWWVVLIVLGFLGFVGSRWARGPGGRQVVDKLKMKAWPVGPLFMKLYMARFARTASTLIASGVPLLQMLEIVAGSINNVHLENSVKTAMEKIKGGKSLSDSIEGDPNFLPLVPSMLRIGEQSGSMEDMMEKTASYYEKEVDDQIKAISTIIEPVMMIGLGISAFMIVAAVLLPIYGLVGEDIVR